MDHGVRDPNGEPTTSNLIFLVKSGLQKSHFYTFWAVAIFPREKKTVKDRECWIFRHAHGKTVTSPEENGALDSCGASDSGVAGSEHADGECMGRTKH